LAEQDGKISDRAQVGLGHAPLAVDRALLDLQGGQ
jgi:hypothetical protein